VAVIAPGTATILAFAGTALVVELTPGPNMTYLALVAATDGRRSGLAAVAGVAVGLSLLGLLAALGLTAAINASPFLAVLLRWVGVAYLLWLAFDAWRDAAAGPSEFAAAGAPLVRHFGRGLLTNLLNPKAAAFFVTVLPGFLPAAAPPLSSNLVLTGLYVLIATGVHAAVVALAGAAQAWLAAPDRARRGRRAGAVALVGVALWLAVA
jgi:threonine/homoserine/homoserine lactone efflux protein